MKIIDFIICDDIRRETNHKLIIIGTYNEKIVFRANSLESKWPISKQLAFFMRFLKEENDPEIDGFDISIDLKTKTAKQLFSLGKIEGIIKAPVNTQAPIIFDIPMPIKFPGPGKMLVTVSFLKGKSIVQTIKPDLEIEIEESLEKLETATR